MKKTGKQTPPNPTLPANQAAAPANTETVSCQALRQERQRLMQELQAINADLDARIDALVISFTQSPELK